MLQCGCCAFCVDIDECTEGSSGCNQNCTNSIGGYSCTCYPGYQLSGDNHTCNGEFVVEPVGIETVVKMSAYVSFTQTLTNALSTTEVVSIYVLT